MIVYAPALTRDDSRPLAVVRGMERARPGLRIGLTISDEGKLIPLQDRDAFVSRETSRGEMPPLRSTADDFLVSVTGWEKPAGVSPGGRAQFEFHLALPLSADGIAAAADLLEAVAESARAFGGTRRPSTQGWTSRARRRTYRATWSRPPVGCL